jgi:ribosomal protein S18 acetylase RimI-like enzyme
MYLAPGSFSNAGSQGFQRHLARQIDRFVPLPAGSEWVNAGRIRPSTCGAAGVLLSRMQPAIGEMKRMFVRPGHRGIGFGKKLALAVLDVAARIGYERIRLDTAPTMTEAIGLYEALGFRRIEPYRHYPADGIIFMEVMLNSIQEHSP